LAIFVSFGRLVSSLPGSNQNISYFRFSGRKATDMFKLQIERTFWKIAIIYAEDCSSPTQMFVVIINYLQRITHMKNRLLLRA